jgi:pSer/pThr/pTyr-binding forkhead associated (FHA) protein
MATTRVDVTLSRKGVSGDEPTTLTFDQFPLMIGSADNNDLVVVDEMISRRHAIVEVRDGGLWLVDVGSVSGTVVNGRLGWGTWPIAPSLAITLGAFNLVFTRIST